MEILELQITITEIEISTNGLNRRMNGREERFNELEDRKWKLLNLNNRGKVDPKFFLKMNRASGTSRTLTEDLIFVSSMSGKERRKIRLKK